MAKTLIILTVIFSSPRVMSVARSDTADIQFFGDLFLPHHILKKTKTNSQSPRLFDRIRTLLDTSRINVVNFEGVASGAFVPLEAKKYLLRMPMRVGQILSNVGIHVATLANNHAMDYGFQGLFDTMHMLNSAGILTSGAGRNQEVAAVPAIVGSRGKAFCILSFSRTLPTSFWAQKDRAGTASFNFTKTGEIVRAWSQRGCYTIAVFHWGQELHKGVKDYQRRLAQLVIRQGARMVVGHHPHVLQPIEFYRGRPIFYSLGNFTFGTMPMMSKPEGMSVRLRVDANQMVLTLVPLIVDNRDVGFRPRLVREASEDPIRTILPKDHPCGWHPQEKTWRCAGF